MPFAFHALHPDAAQGKSPGGALLLVYFHRIPDRDAGLLHSASLTSFSAPLQQHDTDNEQNNGNHQTGDREAHRELRHGPAAEWLREEMQDSHDARDQEHPASGAPVHEHALPYGLHGIVVGGGQLPSAAACVGDGHGIENGVGQEQNAQGRDEVGGHPVHARGIRIEDDEEDGGEQQPHEGEAFADEPEKHVPGAGDDAQERRGKLPPSGMDPGARPVFDTIRVRHSRHQVRRSSSMLQLAQNGLPQPAQIADASIFG